ncbi:hypothetical protein COHA_003751 [Chlorella ohadii]|uniref:Uncharacterized protein n=1 Tax=Chlorella ohadii TaxID=2649997 RepID=A0AAD5H7R3_9CHLO|nr:hypothetical protein COHA_003751 [Chlorella ohadii]
MLAAACTAAKPAVAVRQASSSAPRRNARRAAQRLQPVRAAEDDRAAQLKAAMEQVQSNPEMAAKMKQMEEAMANPAIQSQMGQMMSVMNNPNFMAKMAELREDPELKPVFDEIRSGGMAAMMKYMNDPTFLSKIGAKMGDVMEAPPAAAAAPPPPMEVNNILDAVKAGDLEAIEDYMAVGKGDMKDGEGRSALHYAVAYNQVPAVQTLLDNGADTSARDNSGNPPLHYAAGYGREECVRLLLAAGADVAAKNDKGQTAAEVVRGESRNPLNQSEELMKVLDGTAAAATLG